MALQVSLTNLVASATVTLNLGTAASGYPVTNLKTAWKPFTPLVSTDTTQINIIIDHGSAKAVSVVALIRANFTYAAFWADDLATFNSGGGAPFTSPQYSAYVGTAQGLNGRYATYHCPPAAVTRRYNLIAINPSQPTLATAPHLAGAAYYVLGGVWAGALATVPRDILAEPELERIEPVEDVPLPSGGRSRSIIGYPYVTLGARRLANQDAGGLDTELRAWLALDAQWWATDYALVLPRSTVAADAYVMRRLKGAAWTWSRAYSEGDLMLEEVTG